MWAIIVPLIGGFLLSFKEVSFIKKLPFEAVSHSSLILLLIIMGMRIGGDPEVLDQAGRIGLQALGFALAAIFGSVLILSVLEKTYLSRYKNPDEVQSAGDLDSVEKSENDNPSTGMSKAQQILRKHSLTLKLIASVAAGIAAGLFFISAAHLSLLSQMTTWVLGLLLFGVGLELGTSKKIVGQLKSLGFRVLLLPTGIALGSILGSVVLASLWGVMSWKEAAALASGFGWYSLSAVIITEVHSSTLGALAFLMNVIRELIAIITIPLIAKSVGKLSSIAPGGATTMDVTLPVIAQGVGKKYIPLAFFSGAVLSMMVPILVRFFLLLL